MHNQLLVRVADRFANLEEQDQSVVSRKPATVAPGVDALTLHVLHHQIRSSVGCEPAVEEPRYIRMLELGKNLPLAPEPLVERRRPQDPGGHFHGYSMAQLAILARGEINRAHSAGAQKFARLVGAKTRQTRREQRRSSARRAALHVRV